MNKDPKSRFFMMVLLFLTMMLVMQYLMPTPPSEAPAPAPTPARTEAAAPAAATGAPAAPAAVRDFAPRTDHTVTVRVGDDAKDGHGYEAVFSTVGGSLESYRLLGYYRVPENEEDGNRVILLDRLAPGRDSLRVDSVTSGPDRQSLTPALMGQARFELVEVPADALVEPQPVGVEIGENLVMRTVVGDWELVRTYRFPKAGNAGETWPATGANGPDFTIDFDLQWRNLASGGRLLRYSLIGPAGLVPDDDSANFGLINFLSASQPNSGANSVEVKHTALPGLEKEERMTSLDRRGGLAWIGAKNRFFTALVAGSRDALADSDGAALRLFAGDPGMLPAAEDLKENMAGQPQLQIQSGGGLLSVPAFGETGLTVEPGLVESGAAYTASYRLYAGPAVDEWMEAADPRFQGVISYTFTSYLDFISRWLVWLLNFLNGILGNYGVAIIAVTLIIKLALHPLNRKSFVSMNKMSKLAPRMKEIQAKFASDRVKMQQEVGKLYKENGVSMAGGCLPMFLQLPIFFALYGAFSQGFSMRHAAFLSPWIMDLSKPDVAYDLGWKIPLLGWSVVSILPIVYFVAQYFQMSLQPTPADPQQAQQQKMMKYMPLMFVFLFYTMPAGLVLYFTVSSLAGVAESTYMRRVVLPRLGLGAETPAQAAAGAQAGAGAAAVPSDKKKKQRRK